MFTTELWLSYCNSKGVTVCCSPRGTVLHSKLFAPSLALHRAAQKNQSRGMPLLVIAQEPANYHQFGHSLLPVMRLSTFLIIFLGSI